MIIIDELVRMGTINSLQARDIVESINNGTYLDIDDAILPYKINSHILKEIRAKLFNLPIYDKEIVFESIVFKYLSEDEIRENKVFPIKFQGTLTIGIVHPENEKTLVFLSDKMASIFTNYQLVIISKEEWVKSVDKMLSMEQATDGLVLTTVSSKTADIGRDSTIDLDKVEGVIDDTLRQMSSEDIVDNIIKNSIKNNYSDIHLEPKDKKVEIRARLDGDLKTLIVLDGDISKSVITRCKILANMKLDEKRKPQDGRFGAQIDGYKVDFRVSALPSYWGEKVVMRILDSHKGVKKLSDMEYSEKIMSDIRSAINRPFGLILISGPTGSGKTTTLYSILNELDRRTKNVISLEDPVEYNLDNMTQSQIFPEIGYTFASGLRSILRQDPDIIMVGEIRDAETAGLAIQAALTGHLVFSTIHTNNAAGIIPRLIDMGVEKYLIASTLCLAIAQRLTNRIDTECIGQMDMTPGNVALKDNIFKSLSPEFKQTLNIDRPWCHAVPNNNNATGLKGRIAVIESIPIDIDFQELILGDVNADLIEAKMQEKNIITMQQDAALKCMAGKLPFENILSL